MPLGGVHACGGCACLGGACQARPQPDTTRYGRSMNALCIITEGQIKCFF